MEFIDLLLSLLVKGGISLQTKPCVFFSVSLRTDHFVAA